MVININDKKYDKYKTGNTNKNTQYKWSGATGSLGDTRAVGTTTQTSLNSSYINSQKATYSGSPTWSGATGDTGPGATVTGVPSQGTTGESGVSHILTDYSVPKSHEYETTISTLPTPTGASNVLSATQQAANAAHDSRNSGSSISSGVSQIGSGDPNAIGGGGGMTDTLPRGVTGKTAQWFDKDGFLNLGGNFGTANAQGIGSPTSTQQEYTDKYLKDIQDNIKAEEKKIAAEEKAATHYSVTRGSLDQEFGYTSGETQSKYVPFHDYFGRGKVYDASYVNTNPNATYEIKGRQPSGSDRFGNETIADLVQSGQGSKKYNNIVQKWQVKYLSKVNNPNTPISLGDMNDWVAQQIAKIEKWNISKAEKDLYIKDLRKRRNQMKQFTAGGEQSKSHMLFGARVDPLKGYDAETQWTFSRGAKGEKPGKILTWEDLKDNKGNSWY